MSPDWLRIAGRPPAGEGYLGGIDAAITARGTLGVGLPYRRSSGSSYFVVVISVGARPSAAAVWLV